MKIALHLLILLYFVFKIQVMEADKYFLLWLMLLKFYGFIMKTLFI